jgi:aspartate aminotransferase
MISISKMASAVQPSATLVAGAKARQLRASGVHVFDFSMGEPDFATPPHICEAALEAMRQGLTHYTPAEGLPELRAAIAGRYVSRYGLECGAEEVMVSNGAKHSIHNALTATCGPGDEVIILTPYWVSYSDLVEMTGARPVLVETSRDSGFRLSPARLREVLSSRTRLVMLNSPCNPTGTVYSRSELVALADAIMESRAAVLSDEIYENLVYEDAESTCFATLRPGLAERTITISGASKTYAMTGWRMGWAVGPAAIIRAMANVQSQQSGCPSSISQYATLAALAGSQECVERMRREFDARRGIVCERLRALRAVRFSEPKGAFYVFFDVSALFGKRVAGQLIADSAQFCQAALEVGHVNMVPGSAFGAEGYVRLSFTASRENLEAGLDRLTELIEDAS